MLPLDSNPRNQKERKPVTGKMVKKIMLYFLTSKITALDVFVKIVYHAITSIIKRFPMIL